jgi:Protein of unknown function (DUF2934)
MEPAHETAPLEERIRMRAYELYLQRGNQYVSALDDWLQAEEEIRRVTDSRPVVSESEFWRLLQLLSTEIEDAVTIFHTYEELNRATLDNQEIALALNQEPLFWKYSDIAFRRRCSSFLDEYSTQTKMLLPSTRLSPPCSVIRNCFLPKL